MTVIGGTNVPDQYVTGIQNAAVQSGLPAPVVAAQINLESGFNPQAVSPTGAQGIAQFEPATWATWGSGSPFNVGDALTAYAKYMSSLLSQEKGSIEDALAAYNAGPGNLQAGMGYAQTILTRAGEPATATAGGGAVGGALGDLTGLTGVVSSLSGLAKDFEGMAKVLTWLTLPSNWTRIFAGLFGGAALGVGIYLIGKEAKAA